MCECKTACVTAVPLCIGIPVGSCPCSGGQTGEGVTEHGLLTGRDAVDQHPKSAITNLESDLGALGTKVEALEKGKQDKLIAGTNITITGNVISASGGGSSGTSVHGDLTGRDAVDQHPIAAITDLQARLQSLQTQINGISTAQGGALVGEWRYFRQAPLPAGWLGMDGSVVLRASVATPKLVQYLTAAANETLTEAEWQAMSAAASGTGGVPFYVYDAAADTVRLPDTRGDSVWHGDVGTWEGDVTRKIVGETCINGNGGGLVCVFQKTLTTGALSVHSMGLGNFSFQHLGGAYGSNAPYLTFDSSKVVPTAATNHPRRIGMTHAVYVGTIGA